MAEGDCNREEKKAIKTYEYLIIQFNKRGPKSGTQQYDFVPAQWVGVSKKTGKLVVKFMPPPYVDETSDLLHHLIRSKSDPIADWPEYNIQLKGGAQSYEQAENRVEELDAKEFAFTTDADKAPEEKASEIVRRIKQTKLKVSAETEAALQVSELKSDDDDIANNNDEIIDSLTKSLKRKNKGLECDQLREKKMSRTEFNSKKPSWDGNGNVNVESSKTGKKKADMKLRSKPFVSQQISCGSRNKNLTIVNFDEPSTSQPLTDRSDKFASVDENSNLSEEYSPASVGHQSLRMDSRLSVNEVYTDSENDIRIDSNNTVGSVRDCSLQLSEGYNLLKSDKSRNTVFNKSNKKPQKPTESDKKSLQTSKSNRDASSKAKKPKNKSNHHGDPQLKPTKVKSHKSLSDSDILQQIFDDLQAIKVDVQEIRANQRNEEEIRQRAKVEHGIHESFIAKYKLELPFRNIKAFDEFNSNLLSDEVFREAFMKSLVKLFDRDFVTSKILTNILRKYLSRNLARCYTAIKKMPGKYLLKGTVFCDCLLGVLLETHCDRGGKALTESSFASFLGNVLGNAKDWDGRHNKGDEMSGSEELDSDHI